MTKLYNGTATIDRKLQIARADKQFYDYLGFENYASVAGNVHESCSEQFKKIVMELGDNDTEIMVLRMLAADGQYHNVLAELSVNSVERKDGCSYIDLKIQDIDELENRLGAICDKNSLYEEFLDIWGEKLFSYDVKQNLFQVFTGGNTGKVFLYKGTLEDFKKKLLDQKQIESQCESAIEELCQDISKGVKNFEYKLLFTDSDDMNNSESSIHIVKGRTIANSQGEPVVLGCILKRSENNSGDTGYSQSEFERDVTTGLLTKKAILEYTENLLRSRPKYKVNLCVVDLDNFKQVNDTLGHLFGDEVLATVADILKDAVAGKGVAGRIGGDEMFVVLEGVNSFSDLKGILRIIRSNVEWAYKERKEVPAVTCSIGVSTYPDDALVYDDLFKIADKMLYRAKNKGKNRYIVYSPDIHGDVLSEGDLMEVANNVVQRQDKEDLVLKMMEYVAQKTTRPYELILRDVGTTFGLDEIHIFYGDEKKTLLESYWNANGEEKPQESFADCVHEENFSHLYREHNVAIIDKPDLIEQLCPITHKFLLDHGIKVTLIFKMDCKKHEGYIVYCKKSELSRKWSDSDMANLTYISRMIELMINDR